MKARQRQPSQRRESGATPWPGGSDAPSTQLLRCQCQFLYFCASKASKVSTWRRPAMDSRLMDTTFFAATGLNG